MSMFDDIVEKIKNPVKINVLVKVKPEVAGFEVFNFKLEGFHDEDNDGNPEFNVSFDGLGIDIKDKNIEIPLGVFSGGVFGVITKVLDIAGLNDGIIGDTIKELKNKTK